MTLACIEHLNVTVKDPDLIANALCNLFDWKVRWSGEAMNQGYTVHVGTDQRYLALYSTEAATGELTNSEQIGKVNHIGLKVNDLKLIEDKVKQAGFITANHRDYRVCKSFYFYIDDSLEIEIVSYQ